MKINKKTQTKQTITCLQLFILNLENTLFIPQCSQLHCLPNVCVPIHLHGNARKPPEFSFS